MTSEAVYLPDSEARLTNTPRRIDHQPSVSSPHFDQATDESLMDAVAQGSQEALGLVFRRYRPAVLVIVTRILRDAYESEDLCQEVFLLLSQKAKQFDASKGTASSWIIQIAYHRAMNRRQYLSHRQHYDARELDETQVSGARQTHLIDQLAAKNLLNRLREQLSAEQRKTLELHFFDGYTLAEIAEKTNQSLGNVRHHYYRALERLRSNVFPKKNT